MLKKEKLRNKFCYQQIQREICKSYGPEIKIDLRVKKFSDVSKVNHAKSPLFFALESLETRLDKFSNGLDKFSNGLESLETRLQPRSSKFSRIEDRESSFEYRASRDCQLTFERYCTCFCNCRTAARLTQY